MASAAPPAFAPDPALRGRLERLAIVSTRAHGHLHTGGRRSRAVGSSIEFADHRRYSPGDDFRQIDWNIYARSDDLFIKTRESEETLVVHLLLDTSASMSTGQPSKFELARLVLAALGWVALAGHDLLAGACFGASLGDAFVPVSGRANADRFFEFLARQTPSGGTGLAMAARAYAARGIPHGVAILASDLLSPEATVAVGLLAERGHELTVLHVLDADFLRPDFAEDAELRDIEGGPAVPVFGDMELLAAYRATVSTWLGEVQRFCHQRNVRYVPVESDWPADEVLVRRLRAQGVVA
ncbi:MAG: DUF58 domain-containing protein [Actinobacteria bacterium]|nr:DUF58 domain-containing protein [Actinomycetota bacterium]